ncbi:general secretion pathway protein L [Sphingomonas zeicaulis]|uniref:type II secretion system protein GspL n=1 Tax=Sphingomonas zeicaulis TaxID=1632740 RepID=UPI003D228342
MSNALVLFLPERPDSVWRWLRFAGDAVVGRGEGAETIPATAADSAEIERIVAVAPAGAMTLDWAELPKLAPAQARAAAKLLASENTIQPVEALHVALGEPDDEAEAGVRPMATLEAARMSAWLAALQARGLDPDAIVPAALLLPRPETGFVRGVLGEETVVRGRDSGFVEDPQLAPLLIGDASTDSLDREALERAIAAGVADPLLDLRQGAFARRRRWAIDWKQVRRLITIGVAIAGVTLAISLALILRYTLAADDLERRAQVVAAEALPGGAGQGNAVALLDERLAGIRGGGYGFSVTAGAVFAAVEGVPAVDLNAMTFERDGTMKLTLSAGTGLEVEAVKARLEGLGLRVVPSVFQQSGDRINGDLTVAPR